MLFSVVIHFNWIINREKLFTIFTHIHQHWVRAHASTRTRTNTSYKMKSIIFDVMLETWIRLSTSIIVFNKFSFSFNAHTCNPHSYNRFTADLITKWRKWKRRTKIIFVQSKDFRIFELILCSDFIVQSYQNIFRRNENKIKKSAHTKNRKFAQKWKWMQKSATIRFDLYIQ